MAGATAQGVPVTVHRPAFISNHSLTGHGNPTDYLNRYLAGCVQVRCVAASPAPPVRPAHGLAAYTSRCCAHVQRSWERRSVDPRLTSPTRCLT